MPRTTVVRGERVPLPGTLDEIRAALPPERREEFDQAMRGTPPEQRLRTATLQWALPPEAQEDDEQMHARLLAGDFSGCVDSDGRAVT